MVVSMYSVDSMINAYNKQQRVKARHPVPTGGGERKGKPDDEVTLSKQGIEAADIYNKLTNRLIDNMLKEEKK
ncbi:MAG: hypothetical protein ACYC6Q_10440 [Syntrophales bacterium]